MKWRIKRALWNFYVYLRWGVLNERVVTTAGDGVPAEIEVTDRDGKVCGYWAYGSWDPNGPYRG